MNKIIYVIKDKITEQIEDVFMHVNDGAAVREWLDIATATKRPHITDKSIWRIAKIDIETMQIELEEPKKIDWEAAKNPRTEATPQEVKA